MNTRPFIILLSIAAVLLIVSIAGVFWLQYQQTQTTQITEPVVAEQNNDEEESKEEVKEKETMSGFLQMTKSHTRIVNDVVVETFHTSIINPSTNDKQAVGIVMPKEQTNIPLVVLVQGGQGQGLGMLGQDPDGSSTAEKFASEGMVVVAFDSLGIGLSEGDQNFYGFDDQDGLAAIIQAAKNLEQVDETVVGLASFSYGVTGATGVLSRYPDLGISFFSDWEGPSSRFYTTVGCNETDVSSQIRPNEHDCNDKQYWSQREASELMKDVTNLQYYWRIQEFEDHVQSTYGHTIEMLNSAEEANIPWFRVNDAEVNTTFTEETLPTVRGQEKISDLAIPHVVEMIKMVKS